MLFWSFLFVGTVLFLLSEKCSSCHRKSTVPITGKALFRSPEKHCSDHRKSTVPITGKRIIQFPVCRFLRLSVCKGNGYDGGRLIKS